MDNQSYVITIQDRDLLLMQIYAGIAMLVWLGFMAQRFGWAEPGRHPWRRAFRVVVSGIVVGALWPLWVVIAGIAAIAGSM